MSCILGHENMLGTFSPEFLTQTWTKCESQQILPVALLVRSHLFMLQFCQKCEDTTITAIESADEDAFSHVAAFQFCCKGSLNDVSTMR